LGRNIKSSSSKIVFSLSIVCVIRKSSIFLYTDLWLTNEMGLGLIGGLIVCDMVFFGSGGGD
jgi:hypothetical protein